MAARIFSLISYVVAGFFLYSVAIIGFIVVPETRIKIVIMAGFTIPALLGFFAGFAWDNFRHKARDAGIVLLSVATLDAFSILTWACVVSSDKIRKTMPPGLIEMYSDYRGGFGYFILLLGGGVYALRIGLKKSREIPPLASS